jgi:glycosyltransferase involved in cell wall biosynthesis
MRVLLLTSLLPDAGAAAGGAVVMHGTLQSLLRRHDVALASFMSASDADAAERLRTHGVTLRGVVRPTAGGVRALPRRARLAARWLRTRDPLRALAFRSPAMQRAIDALAAERRFDLIQVEDNAMGAYDLPAGVPALLTEHEVRAARSGERDAAGLLARADAARWAGYQCRVWRRFARVQVFTEADAAALRTLCPEVAARVRVNPFGVTVPPLADAAPDTEAGLVFVGAFAHPPNVGAACWLAREFMPALRARRPGVRLVLVGADPPARVRRLASEDVIITGRVASVPPFLHEAAVVVAPVRAGGGMRVKVLEAMAAGKAVVTTPVGAEGIASGTAPLIIADTLDEWVAAVDALLAEPEKRSALGRAARRFVAERHGWEAYGRRLDAIHAELVSEA